MLEVCHAFSAFHLYWIRCDKINVIFNREDFKPSGLRTCQHSHFLFYKKSKWNNITQFSFFHFFLPCSCLVHAWKKCTIMTIFILKTLRRWQEWIMPIPIWYVIMIPWIRITMISMQNKGMTRNTITTTHYSIITIISIIMAIHCIIMTCIIQHPIMPNTIHLTRSITKTTINI